MSVINQMLKDLEQRSPESGQLTPQPANNTPLHSPIKIIALTAILMLVICFIGFYVWQLTSENNALRAEKRVSEVKSTLQLLQGKQVKDNMPLVEGGNNDAVPARVMIDSVKAIKDESIKAKAVPHATSPEVIQPVAKNIVLKENPQKVGNIAPPLVTPKHVERNNTSKVTPAKKVQAITQDHIHPEGTTAHQHESPETANMQRVNKMSVSRRQLSADELAQQKLASAEKALAAKQITKAETLFEDVLIIKPGDSQTRKKLAALWFGRQAYQDATNLLSQGISLNSKDSSLREMKARIHLQQGHVTTALNTLKPLAQLKDQKYQVMLANTAQQARQNEVAVKAYKVLISMQPEMGRWQLALAVLYDKNSQFSLANKAYKKALTKNDLSASSEKFVQQRIQVIGQ